MSHSLHKCLPEDVELTLKASVQELVLVSLVVQLSRIEFDPTEIVRVIRSVQIEAGKYIKKVCQIVFC